MNTTFISNPDLLQIYQECITKISKDKNIIDIACGPGWAGKMALEAGAKSVTFADARVERFVHPQNYTNYQQKFIDLNFTKTLDPLLVGCDTALYFGHLYHSNNHEEILDSLINSDCKDFLIDTKVGLDSYHIDLDIPTIYWTNPEPVSDPFNGWHSTESHVIAGNPNLSWMLDYFNRNKLEVKLQKSADYIHVADNVDPAADPYCVRIYIFHVVKS